MKQYVRYDNDRSSATLWKELRQHVHSGKRERSVSQTASDAKPVCIFSLSEIEKSILANFEL